MVTSRHDAPARWAAARRVAAACLLVLSAGWLGGCAVGRAEGGPNGTTVRVLQMNLCDSGRAGCYAGGRAVGVAAALVHRHRPDIVTLNEVCRGDVDVLEQAMSATFHGAAVASAFVPAQDRSTHASVRCRNGQEFGDGVATVLPTTAHGFSTRRGLHPTQDPGDVEERVWVCVDVVARFSACTTHAASTSTTIALAQCRYLLGSATATGTARGDGGGPIIVAGDLNLAAGGSPDPPSCVPRGYHGADDGALQYVLASPGVAVRSRSVIDMHGATDHPGLLVDLVLPPR